MSKAPWLALPRLVLPPTLRVMTEVLPSHTTNLWATYGSGAGGKRSPQVRLSLAKLKAHYTAHSNAVAALSMDMTALLTADKLAALPAPTLPSPPNTTPRPVQQLLRSLAPCVRPTEAAVDARVAELIKAVPACIITAVHDVGELTVEAATAEYARLLREKGARRARAHA
eukprot:scaffold127257_cov63-Phaeocystis_antarctica.AAC.1